MIHNSVKNKKFADFDWESYSKYYIHLKKEGFSSKEQLWWHYVTIGEANEYRFFNINEKIANAENKRLFDFVLYSEYYPFLKKHGFVTRDELWWHYLYGGQGEKYLYFNRNYTKSRLDYFIMFDEYKYLLLYPYLYEQGFRTKEELLNHYLTFGKDKGYTFCTSYEEEKEEEKEKEKEEEKKEGAEEKKENTTFCNKTTVYYYIDNCIKHTLRSGIQVVSIYLAKELLKKTEIDVIFVKWTPTKKALCPCHTQEIDFFLNYAQNGNIDPIKYENYQPVHLNNYRSADKCIFFCPEVTFAVSNQIPETLFEYLNKHHFKSTYIVYDIIPLVLPKYDMFKDGFRKYLEWNLLNANKLIAISKFTKIELEMYTLKNKLYRRDFPILKSILLPYQYRNQWRIRSVIKPNQTDKVIILVPGTTEFRKQQVLLMKMFNFFIENNPSIHVEMLLFGNITSLCKEDVDKEIEKSKGKIINLGLIDNDILSDYYRKASFSCFISLYEGYGFPISESLWHGTPVLTSNFGSMSEVAQVGGCFTVDVREEEEIYRGLDTLIKNPDIIIQLKRDIQKMPLTTWSEYGDKILQELIAN